MPREVVGTGRARREKLTQKQRPVSSSVGER